MPKTSNIIFGRGRSKVGVCGAWGLHFGVWGFGLRAWCLSFGIWVGGLEITLWVVRFWVLAFGGWGLLLGFMFLGMVLQGSGTWALGIGVWGYRLKARAFEKK